MARILIIDDDQGLLAQVVPVLTKAGHEVLIETDGLEGASAVRSRKPDLVILDVLIPRLNGLDLCTQLRADPATSHVALLLTSSIFIPEPARAEEITLGSRQFRMCCDRVLNKPVKPAEVLAAVDGLLRKQAPAPALPLVLVVDDNQDNIDLLSKRLRTGGYQVLAASNGREGLELAQRQQPSLVITDIQMPEMDGIQLLRALRETLPDVAVIMMTAFGSEDIAVEAMKLGADDYVKKPIDHQEVAAKVAETLDRARLRTENRRLLTQLMGSNACLIGKYEQLENAKQELEDYSRNLELKVTEKAQAFKGAHLMLEEAYRRLQAMDRTKTDFLAMMSHELKTPLTVIKGYLDLMTGGKFGQLPNGQLDPIKAASRSTARLQQQIEDLLELSALELYHQELKPEPLDLAAVINAAVKSASDDAAAKKLEMLVRLDGPLPKVMADSRGLATVLRCLLSNAVKFSEKGTVAIGAKQDSDTVSVWVSDQGIGIDAKELPYLFEPFYQTETALTRKHGGVGVGLALVKRILEAHKTAAEVESQPGQGTTFRFKLKTAG